MGKGLRARFKTLIIIGFPWSTVAEHVPLLWCIMTNNPSHSILKTCGHPSVVSPCNITQSIPKMAIAE